MFCRTRYLIDFVPHLLLWFDRFIYIFLLLLIVFVFRRIKIKYELHFNILLCHEALKIIFKNPITYLRWNYLYDKLTAVYLIELCLCATMQESFSFKISHVHKNKVISVNLFIIYNFLVIYSQFWLVDLKL